MKDKESWIDGYRTGHATKLDKMLFDAVNSQLLADQAHKISRLENQLKEATVENNKLHEWINNLEQQLALEGKV